MYIGVCDDEQAYREQITALLEKQSCPIALEIVQFATIEELLSFPQKIDLLFLDIEVGQENSLQVLNRQTALQAIPLIVLVSAHSCYVSQSYAVPVFQYLLKPLQPVLFEKVFMDCWKKYQVLQQYCAVKTTSGVTRQLPLCQIGYVQSQQRKVLYYDLQQVGYYGSELSLSTTLRRLQTFGFCQISKNCLVNLSKVFKFSGEQVILNLEEKQVVL